MKRRLDSNEIAAAVWGGAILGGGGGGFPASGEKIAKLATEIGSVELWSIDEFAGDDLTATVALVGAPAAPNPYVDTRHTLNSLNLLREALPSGRTLKAINTNENGAETTVNGWVQAALTGLPVMDLACNGRAHPTSQMGSMGLHLERNYVSIQAYSGGRDERYVEGVAKGRLDGASGIVRRASVEAGGLVTVARNPVSVKYAAANGAPGAISFALELGRAWLDGGVDAAVSHLGGTLIGEGEVTAYSCEQREGLDVGYLQLAGKGQTTLHFINEYMVAEQNGDRIHAFPDLLMTFDGTGRPIVSAQVRQGMQIKIVRVPAAKLRLSRTMFMPELYRPLEGLLNIKFAPEV